MSIRKCEEPVSERHDNLANIYAFIASGWEYAEVELDGRTANAVYHAMLNAIRRKGITDVRVTKRGEHVYLVAVNDD